MDETTKDKLDVKFQNKCIRKTPKKNLQIRTVISRSPYQWRGPARVVGPRWGDRMIKIWPLVLLTAIRNKRGGAARLWFLAKSLDPNGSGKVGQTALFEHLADLGIGDRKRQRWVKAALKLGLFRISPDKHYWMAGWGRGAGMLGCSQIGNPASVTARPLVSPGWRAHVWAGYLSTLEGRMISQETKHRLTGVDVRTQRNYQSKVVSRKMQNYSTIEERRDFIDGHIFHDPVKEKDVQKLPDIPIVPMEVARSVPKGRSRKAQGELNTLGKNSFSKVAGSNNSVARLFNDTLKDAKRAIRKSEFGEAFWLKNTYQNANQWGLAVQL